MRYPKFTNNGHSAPLMECRLQCIGHGQLSYKLKCVMYIVIRT